MGTFTSPYGPRRGNFISYYNAIIDKWVVINIGTDTTLSDRFDTMEAADASAQNEDMCQSIGC